MSELPAASWRSLDGEPAPLMKVVCPKCGSGNVTRDAVARWSVEDQKWELAGEYDDMNCQEDACGYEGHSFDEVVAGGPDDLEHQFQLAGEKHQAQMADLEPATSPLAEEGT